MLFKQTTSWDGEKAKHLEVYVMTPHYYQLGPAPLVITHLKKEAGHWEMPLLGMLITACAVSQCQGVLNQTSDTHKIMWAYY